MAKSKVKIEYDLKPNSRAFFKPHWLCWILLGIPENIDPGHRTSFMFYSVIINIWGTIWYPLHLALYLIQSDVQSDNIKNLVICIASATCSLKFLVYAAKMPVIRQIQLILQQLDDRINDGLEWDYFFIIKRRLRLIAMVFCTVYSLIGIMAEVTVWCREDRSLLYLGWFPFNWLESTWKYHVAHFYQIVGVVLLALQNFANDCFPSTALCILSGHIKLLSIRVASIGYDGVLSKEDNEEELNRCIIDQNNLYQLQTKIENVISMPMFIQYCVTATNSCMAMAALLFYVSTPSDILYYIFFFLGLALQVFPTCYYGSDFKYQFEQLHQSVFASNWTNQSVKFKKHMLLFTERSLKSTMALAGGMVPIHLNTFFSIYKAAYSLFAIIVQMK